MVPRTGSRSEQAELRRENRHVGRRVRLRRACRTNTYFPRKKPSESSLDDLVARREANRDGLRIRA